MASITPHLLSLPREIRDEIYSYLHHELELESPLYTAGVNEYIVTKVRILNSPFLGVLLAHSRLRDEYQKADCFLHLTATLQANYNPTPLGPRSTNARTRAALSKTKHVTITMCASERSETHRWSAKIIDTLTNISPELRSLCVVMWDLHGYFEQQDLDAVLHGPPTSTKPDRLAIPPAVFKGLQLVKLARGLHTGLHTLYTAIDVRFTQHAQYRVDHVAVHLYAIGGSAKHSKCQEDVASALNMRPYHEAAFKKLWEETRVGMVARSKKIMAWQEWTPKTAAVLHRSPRTMAKEPPHLLSLPREVRDEVYSYLHHELEVNNALPADPEETDGWYKSLSVRLENAPLISVLLTHSRLRDEYMDADCFRNLSVILHWRDFQHYYSGVFENPLQQRDRLIRAGLKRAKAVTMSIGVSNEEDVYPSDLGLTNMATSPVPNMKHLRIIFTTYTDVIPHSALVLQDPLATNPPFSVAPRLPDIVAGLARTAHGVGNHLGYSLQKDWEERHGLMHQLSRFHAYYYGSPDDKKFHWSHEDVIAVQKLPAYPQHILDMLPQDVAKELVVRSSQILYWQEWTDGEVKELEMAKNG